MQQHPTSSEGDDIPLAAGAREWPRPRMQGVGGWGSASFAFPIFVLRAGVYVLQPGTSYMVVGGGGVTPSLVQEV